VYTEKKPGECPVSRFRATSMNRAELEHIIRAASGITNQAISW
jgi:hypothetical protein